MQLIRVSAQFCKAPVSMTQTASDPSIAMLHYGDGEFIVLKGGSHVRCAVTSQPIALPALRYWSVERQEAYAGPLEYMKAHDA